MSLITINQNITNTIPIFGEGNVSYTCPQDKRSFLTVSMCLSYIRCIFSNDLGFIDVDDFKNRTYTFNIELKGGDAVTFFESGESLTSSNITLNTSFVINSTTTIARSLAANQTTNPQIDSYIRYAANISYSAIEYPA